MKPFGFTGEASFSGASYKTGDEERVRRPRVKRWKRTHLPSLADAETSLSRRQITRSVNITASAISGVYLETVLREELLRISASALFPEVPLQLRGVQAVRNLRKVQQTNSARWIDVPGIAKDLYTGEVVERRLVACIV